MLNTTIINIDNFYDYSSYDIYIYIYIYYSFCNFDSYLKL
jgi:hypothetical protein